MKQDMKNWFRVSIIVYHFRIFGNWYIKLQCIWKKGVFIYFRIVAKYGIKKICLLIYNNNKESCCIFVKLSTNRWEEFFMSQNWLNLDGKVAIVTGGASGIGKHIAQSLVQVGATAVVVDMNVQTGTEAEGVFYVQCDVTDRTSVQAMVDLVVEKYGKIDALVNNAGINLPRLLVDVVGEQPQYELDDNAFEKMFAVNVKGVFLCAQACAKQMVKQKSGVIINMSSESGKEGSQGQSAYAATKGAVDSFTRSWAKELGKYQIRVLACAPGIMEATGLRTTAYNEALAYTRGCKPEELSTDYSKVIPLGRDGKLDEVGDLVTYLISDRASYIAGTTINISGGKSRG